MRPAVIHYLLKGYYDLSFRSALFHFVEGSPHLVKRKYFTDIGFYFS
jgi:hypothetical protein